MSAPSAVHFRDSQGADVSAVDSPPGGRTGHRYFRHRQSTQGTHRAPMSAPLAVQLGDAQGAEVGAVRSPPRGRTGHRCRRRRQSTQGTHKEPVPLPSVVHPGYAQGAFNHIMDRAQGMSTRRCRPSWSAAGA